MQSDPAIKEWQPPASVTWLCERCGCTWTSYPEGFCENLHDEPPRCRIVEVRPFKAAAKEQRT